MFKSKKLFDKNIELSLTRFYQNVTICSIVLRCKYYFTMYFDQYLKKSWFLISKCFVQKINPAPQKVTLWRVYVKFSNQTYFVVCTGCQASTKAHNYRHCLCMFVNASFQNLGKLNTGFDVIIWRITNKPFRFRFRSIDNLDYCNELAFHFSLPLP